MSGKYVNQVSSQPLRNLAPQSYQLYRKKLPCWALFNGMVGLWEINNELVISWCTNVPSCFIDGLEK